MLRRIACITAVLAATVLVAGCADSGFNYVKTSEDKTYFKVPKRWTLFDEDTVMDGIGADLTKTERQTERDQTWQVAFDASAEAVVGPPRRQPAPTTRPGSRWSGSSRSTTSDTMSNSVLRNYFFDVDTALQDQHGRARRVRGARARRGLPGLPPGGEPRRQREAHDDRSDRRWSTRRRSKLYALLVSCSTVCYDENKGQIAKVVDSWTVRDK